jgi:DHA2 family multidrug resistance protein
VWLAIDIDKPDFSLLRGFDVTGLLLMAIFLGCLQYALEEGPRWDWLDEKTIRVAVIVSAVAGSLFFWRVVSYHQPIVDLRAFLHRNFALGSFFTFMLGIGMYGTTYLVPLFLAQARGFSALQIGETVFVVGLAQLVLSPFNVYIARAMDLRLMQEPDLLAGRGERRPVQTGRGRLVGGDHLVVENGVVHVEVGRHQLAERIGLATILSRR